MSEIRNLPNANQNIEMIAYKASVIIPLIITILCTILDLLSKSRIQEIDIFKIRYVSEVIVSYFFPSIMASALGIMWTHYFGMGYTGLRKGYALRFSGVTGILFVIYLIYLFLADSCFIYVFLICLILYMCIIPKCYMEDALLSGAGLQQDSYNAGNAAGKDA